MKSINVWAIGILTALAATAISVSSAAAETTALCSADEVPCAVGNTVFSVHETSVGKAIILNPVIKVECNVLFSGTMEVALQNGGPVTISGGFTYSNCTEGCVVTEENGPARVAVLREGHETSSVTGEWLVHTKCGSFYDCLFTALGLKGTGKGPLLSAQTPDNGEISIQDQVLNREQPTLLCSKTNKLDIVLTPLTATYISS